MRLRILGILDERFLRILPGKYSMMMRIAFLRFVGAQIGQNVCIASGVRVIGPQNLIIEDGASVARDTVLDARGGLTLRTGALIGFESIILSSTHNSNDVRIPVHEQGMFVKSVVVGANAWLGTRCIVQPGAEIGDGVIVGSGSVVTKDLEPYSIYGGIPARKIRDRN